MGKKSTSRKTRTDKIDGCIESSMVKTNRNPDLEENCATGVSDVANSPTQDDSISMKPHEILSENTDEQPSLKINTSVEMISIDKEPNSVGKANDEDADIDLQIRTKDSSELVDKLSNSLEISFVNRIVVDTYWKRFTRHTITRCRSKTSRDYDEPIFGDNIIFNNIFLQTKDGHIISIWTLSPRFVNSATRYVLCLHGLNTDRIEFARYLSADRLVEMNMFLIIPDYRGFAEVKGIFTFEGGVIDAERCVEYASGNLGAKNIYIIGHELGGNIALKMYANNRDDMLFPVRKLALFSISADSDKFFCTKRMYFIRRVLMRNLYDSYKQIVKFDSTDDIKSLKGDDVIFFHGNLKSGNRFEDLVLLADIINCKIYKSDNDNSYSILNNNEVHITINKFINQD